MTPIDITVTCKYTSDVSVSVMTHFQPVKKAKRAGCSVASDQESRLGVCRMMARQTQGPPKRRCLLVPFLRIEIEERAASQSNCP